MLTRSEIAKYITSNPKAAVSYDNLQRQTANNATGIEAGVAATKSLNDATVLVLSQNEAFDNERILALGNGLTFDDAGPGGDFTILLTYLITLSNAHALRFDISADTELTLPTSGTVIAVPNAAYANDSAAAAGGVAIGSAYKRTDGVIAWRMS